MEKFTEEMAHNAPAGGVLIGEREGQTIVHSDGTMGGYLVGRLHKEDGIKVINKATGRPLEMQGAEVVITAPAVANQQKKMFKGKMMTNRQILSEINTEGGGVSFADGGEIPSELQLCGDARYDYGGDMLTGHEIAQKMSSCSCEHNDEEGKQKKHPHDATEEMDDFTEGLAEPFANTAPIPDNVSEFNNGGNIPIVEQETIDLNPKDISSFRLTIKKLQETGESKKLILDIQDKFFKEVVLNDPEKLLTAYYQIIGTLPKANRDYCQYHLINSDTLLNLDENIYFYLPENLRKPQLVKKLDFTASPSSENLGKITDLITSDDELRPRLMAVHFNVGEKQVECTDAHKLLIIKEKPLIEESSLCLMGKRKEQFVKDKLNNASELEKTEEGCWKINDNYPLISNVIPSQVNDVLTVDAEKLLQYAKASEYFADRYTNTIVIAFVDEGELKYFATNAVFFIDCLKAMLMMGHKKLDFGMISPSKPMIMVPKGNIRKVNYNGVDTDLILMMPVKIDSSIIEGGYPIYDLQKGKPSTVKLMKNPNSKIKVGDLVLNDKINKLGIVKEIKYRTDNSIISVEVNEVDVLNDFKESGIEHWNMSDLNKVNMKSFRSEFKPSDKVYYAIIGKDANGVVDKVDFDFKNMEYIYKVDVRDSKYADIFKNYVSEKDLEEYSVPKNEQEFSNMLSEFNQWNDFDNEKRAEYLLEWNVPSENWHKYLIKEQEAIVKTMHEEQEEIQEAIEALHMIVEDVPLEDLEEVKEAMEALVLLREVQEFADGGIISDTDVVSGDIIVSEESGLKYELKELGQDYFTFKNHHDHYISHTPFHLQVTFRKATESESDFYHSGEEYQLLAPNGKPSNLNVDQANLVRTPAFKKWFGDWEKAYETGNYDDVSKVIDENGEPLVVFRAQKNNRVQTEERRSNTYGIYYSANKESTEKYGNIVTESFLNIINPIILENKEWNLSIIPKYIYEDYKKKGIDGAIWKRNNEFYEVVAFEPAQIKNADWTNTTFDGNNPDIRYDSGGTLYSFPSIKTPLDSNTNEE